MRKRNIAIVAIVALVIGGGIYNFTNSNKDTVDTYLTATAEAENHRKQCLNNWFNC
jgi:uncharacterized protein YxeA